MHRLLRTYERRLVQNTLRLPLLQDPGNASVANFKQTLIDPDSSLRRLKTRPNKCMGPLNSPQRFTSPAMGANTPEQMAAGAHKMNARRSANKTRGASAGI